METQTSPDKIGKIFSKIPVIMGELEAIGRNQSGPGYKFRGIDDLYNALGPLMAKVGVFTAPTVLASKRSDVVSKNGAKGVHVFLRIQYRFYADDGSFFDTVVVGEGIDYGDKAANKAESIAHKYALTQVFIVRTKDQEDPDSERLDLGSVKPQAKKTGNLPPKLVEKPPVNAPEKALPEAPAPTKWTPSMPQRKLLWACASSNGWEQADVKTYIKQFFKIDSTKDLNRAQFDDLLKVMEEMKPSVTK